MIPLQLLRAGETGRVVDIDGEVSWVNRLDEMGIRPGTRLRVVQGGVPCIIAVENHRYSFRGDKAAAILVEPEVVG